MRRGILTRLAAAVASFAVIAAACSGGPAPASSVAPAVGASAPSSTAAATAQNTTPYTIGMNIDLSGPISVGGKQNLAGLQTYIKELNDSGGVNGRKINLVALDDRSDVTVARANYRQLADQKALAVFGFILTATLAAIAPTIEQEKVPTFSLGGPIDLLVPPRPYMYAYDLVQGLQADVQVKQVETLARAAGKSEVRVGYIGADTPADRDHAAKTKKLVEQRPGWSYVTEQWTPIQIADISAQAAALKAARPDYVVLIHNDSGALAIVRGMRQQGLDVPVVNVTAGAADTTFQQLGRNYIAWRTFVSPAETSIPAVVSMRAAAAKAGQESAMAGPYFTGGYVAGMLIRQILERCGANCDSGQAFNAAAEKVTSFDSRGLAAGSLGFSPQNHMLLKAVWYYGWDTTSNAARRISDVVTVD